MTNENERPYPAGYYFDDKRDGVAETPIEVPAESPVETQTESPIAVTETVKAPEISPSEVAKQRREGVVNFFKNTKENFKSKVQSAGAGLRRFFGKTKALGGTIIEGSKALGNETLDVIIAPDAYIKKGTENLRGWVKNKAETISNFAKGKEELIVAIANLMENKTIEKVDEIQAKIYERYESIKQYGNDAIESAADRIRDVKEAFRNAKNNLIIIFLKSIEETHRAKADKVAKTIELLQGLK